LSLVGYSFGERIWLFCFKQARRQVLRFGGRFYALWGDIVIYEIWEAISVSKGVISAGRNKLKLSIDSKKIFIYLFWNQSI